MFKSGGTIRDDQVQIELVEKLEKDKKTSFPQIKLYYFKRIEDQRDEFFLRSVDFDYDSIPYISGQIHQILDQIEDNELERSIIDQLHNSMDRLKQSRYDLSEPDLLHDFRTKFKENGYVAEMIYQSKYTHKVTKAVFSKMKEFGLELGNWHDYYNLYTKAAIIFEKSKSSGLLKEAYKLKKLVLPIHEKLFQEILHIIKRDDTIFEI
jgi:CHAD domain-containing protein